jgi:hypothetical protein
MILLGNCSPQRQMRWATAVLPKRQANSLPDFGLLHGTFFAKGRSRPCGTNVHLLADMQGRAKGVLPVGPVAEIVPPQPGLSSLVPDPTQLSTHLRVGNAQRDFVVKSATSDSPYKTRIHMVGGLDGWFGEMFYDVWSWQDVVDVYGYIVWSDRNDPGHWSKEREVAIGSSHGMYSVDYGDMWSVDGGSEVIVDMGPDNRFPDAMMIPFYGTWIPPIPPSGAPPGDPLEGMWDIRESTMGAALGGPVMALSGELDGEWFGGPAIGVRPEWEGDADVEFARFEQLLGQIGFIHDAREFANPKRTGATGDQKPFGASKDYIAAGDKWTQQDARRIWQLRESTVDYMLRCHHHRETDGSLVRHADHPGWRTWNLCTHRTGSDMLGKSSETPGGSHAFYRAMADDQHRGDTYIGCVRHLTDDPLLEVDLLDRIEGDKARAKRGSLSHIGWPADAPRAAGRLLQSWSMAWWTAWNDDSRGDAEILSTEEFELWEEFINEFGNPIRRDDAGLGPVRPGSIIATDARVIAGGPAWMPWQEACLCVGLMAQCRTWYRAGNKDLAVRFKNLFMEIAGTCIQYGTVRGTDGLIYPLNGVLWLPNGEANPPSYYTFPRAGAGFANAYDMLVGTRGWFANMGWPTMVKGFLQFSEPGTVRDRAQEIMDTGIHGGVPANSKQAEWLVGVLR